MCFQRLFYMSCVSRYVPSRVLQLNYVYSLISAATVPVTSAQPYYCCVPHCSMYSNLFAKSFRFKWDGWSSTNCCAPAFAAAVSFTWRDASVADTTFWKYGVGLTCGNAGSSHRAATGYWHVRVPQQHGSGRAPSAEGCCTGSAQRS